MILAGSGMCPKMPGISPKGSPTMIGSVLSRRMRSTPVSRARRSPRVRKSAVSWLPIETIGWMGTPMRNASRTYPFRPPKSTRPCSHVGRKTSWSPPG